MKTRVVSGTVVKQLEALFDGGTLAGLTDRQLLERFLTGGREPAGEAAFAALVSRHGPMVMGLCRQLLGDLQHAEDAFQAVFVVLAQRARTIRDPDLLGNWLYGVALKTAQCARQKLRRQRRREDDGMIGGPGEGSCERADATTAPAERPAIDREHAEAVHREIDRLPRTFRLPVVLCYFEGLTLDEAARRLRCPPGTIGSRLARAREKLKIGLSRQGVALPALTLGVLIAPRTASASIPPLLCDSTTRAAIQFAAHHAAGGALTASAAALAQEVIQTMFFHKLRLAATTLLFMAAVATGAGWLGHSLAMKQDPVKEQPPTTTRISRRDADTNRRTPKPIAASDERMTVVGRVLDSDGKPIAGANVDLIARPRAPWVGASDAIDQHTLLGQGQSGRDGRYQLDSPRTGSIRVFEVFAVASAPGYGLGWLKLNPDAEQPVGDVRLEPEEVVRVRLTDVTGSPARNVDVVVAGIGRTVDSERREGIGLRAKSPESIRVWPRPVKTDQEGRIALTGIGRGSTVSLSVSDLRYARQTVAVDPARSPANKETTIALEPARLIEGRVLAEDTGRPIPNAIVSASALVMNENARGYFTAKFRADDQGRFTMNPTAADQYTLGAFPPAGEPYLIAQDDFLTPKGAVKATHDIKLKRGVLIRGKVTEAGTDRPLAASSVMFFPVGGGDRILSGWHATVASQEDGSFQVAVKPGKGHLLVFGPTGDYVLGEIGSNRLYHDLPGGERRRAHAIIAYDVNAGDPPIELAARLRPGVTIKGHARGPAGETVSDGFILTTLRIEPFSPSWRGDFNVPIRDGRFELHGLAPDGSTRIHAFDPDHEWGATLDVSGSQAGEDVAIRLQPCGQARVRFLGPDGQPVAGKMPMFELVVTPGPSLDISDAREQSELAADASLVVNVDHKHYGNLPATDADGRIVLGSLIPGALYRISDFSTSNVQNVRKRIIRDFTVKPGETLDLGDIVIAKTSAE